MATIEQVETDFEDAERGFVGTAEQTAITAADGRVVFDPADYDFLAEPAPPTVHPGLWRQSALNARHGLFEVTAGIYQVRGFDISNMTLIEGATGVIVVDPLCAEETAAAALALYRRHRGDRRVTAVIYTHPHADHFGGVLGIVDPDTRVPIVAPEHFLEHAVAENVYAGVAMLRRGFYYGGDPLPRSPRGCVGIGLGVSPAKGSIGLVAPTVEITTTGEAATFDGVEFVFQLTPGTEAPAEMNFHLPGHRALCMAENTTHTMHNLLTLRGAQVRDPRIWSRYIAEAVELFGHDSDVLFASHHWPTWGRERLLGYLTAQRDLYAFLHDQSVRLMNQGLTGAEIAEQVELPESLAETWHVRGYYGSVSHNVKAVYQRYLGWYDGNPAHLWQHPPVAQAQRWVGLLGGTAATLDRAREFADSGDLRFAAELASHAVFADPDDTAAKEVLAGVFERLGLGAENATWRNAYLTGAHELRNGITGRSLSSGGMAPALTVTQLFDTVAIRLVPERARGARGSIRWSITDTGERYRMELGNEVLVHFPTRRSDPADLTVGLTRAQLFSALETGDLADAETTGDPALWRDILAMTDRPDPSFPVVTP